MSSSFGEGTWVTSVGESVVPAMALPAGGGGLAGESVCCTGTCTSLISGGFGAFTISSRPVIDVLFYR